MNLLYFSHDAKALSDPKIQIMIEDYGIVAYAYWWTIVEMLAQDDGNRIMLDKKTKRYFRHVWKISDEQIDTFFDNLVNEYELLFIDDYGCFGSISFDRRIRETQDKKEARRQQLSENARKAANARWNKRNAEAHASNADAYANNANASKIIMFWQNNIGQINSLTLERITDLVNDYGENNVLEAVEKAHSLGKASIGYITKILENQALDIARRPTVPKNKYPKQSTADVEE